MGACRRKDKDSVWSVRENCPVEYSHKVEGYRIVTIIGALSVAILDNRHSVIVIGYCFGTEEMANSAVKALVAKKVTIPGTIHLPPL